MESRKIRYLTSISQVPQLDETQKIQLRPVAARFAFRSNDYYQSLIDWRNPEDPIRALVVPNPNEMKEWGPLDASGEHMFTPVPGLEHKYRDTALLLVNDVCGAFCRYCFRKRLFMNSNDEVVRDVRDGIAYIQEHPEINNVLLTGGDPLIMSTSKLEPILRQLRSIEHVRIVRIGTKMPAFNPFRVIDDPSLLDMLRAHSSAQKRVYIMAHFNHPRELTAEAKKALALLLSAGAIVVNQSPVIRGVNDNVRALANLFEELSFIGVPPYYIFQCRPTAGNAGYSVPLEEAYSIFSDAQCRVSGLAKRARFVMSHHTGKIEVVGMTTEQVVFRYHRAARAEDVGRTMICRRNPRAHWLDDDREAQEAESQSRSSTTSLVTIRPPQTQTGRLASA